ncbi:hypothetical protein AVO43_01930 [Microbulbifer sp. ZGT114]|nr:hypothetical protein AVO43_01930 [Microbulbifer sp. ZGT114]
MVGAYAAAGYVVVVPDYRGHNESAGFEFTERFLAPHWYARDLLGALNGLLSLQEVDADRVFAVGHSMGSTVLQLAAPHMDARVRAVSLWSTARLDYRARILANAVKAQGGMDRHSLGKPDLRRFEEELRAVKPIDSREFAELQVPVLMHHAEDDQVTPLENSLVIAMDRYLAGTPYTLHTYDSDAHLLKGEQFEQAVSRDLDFFSGLSD